MAARRNTKLYIAIAVVVMTAAVVEYLAYSRRSHAITEKDSILVADFVNTTGDVMFDGTLRKALAVDLGAVAVSERHSRSESAADAEAHGTRAGRARHQRNGPRNLPAQRHQGTAERFDRRHRQPVPGHAVGSECATGDTLAEVQQQAANKDAVLDALGKALSSLRGKLGESLASIQKFDKPLEEATTSSLEALKAYTLGEEQHGPKGNDMASIPLLPARGRVRSELRARAMRGWQRCTTIWASREKSNLYRKQSLRTA